MAFSKENRIKLFIVVDIIFFLIEIVIGYTAHSLALVADAFHMLNDVISLCVGLWAVRVATTKESTYEFTYGWARAEILGGLVNGVFLVALCLTIFLDAIQRFFEPQEVSNPKLVLIVGGIGLVFNILGLFVFHQGHSHGGEHDEDEHSAAEEGVGHNHPEDISPKTSTKDAKTNGSAHAHKSQSVQWNIDGQAETSRPERVLSRASRGSVSGHSRRPGSRNFGIDDIPIHPGSIRSEIISQARMREEDEDSYEETPYTDEEAVETTKQSEASENTPLLRSHSSPANKPQKIPSSPSKASPNGITHHEHRHNKPRSGGGGGGHGHSHGDMNIRGMFLHVLGDALGNVGVMTSALIIWLAAPWQPRFYFDPLISLLITGIILKSAIPLCKETAKPLLQAVPEDLSVEDIKEDIESLPGIRSCHHLHVWALTPSKRIATLDVALDCDYDPQRYMQIAKEIKRCLHAYGIHSSTIQPEFSRNEACQLDCVDGKGADKKCCTPADGSGTATPTSKSGGDGHSHSHGHDHHGHSH